MDFVAFMYACKGVHTNPSWLLGNPDWLCVHTYEIYIYQQVWFLGKFIGFHWFSIDFIVFMCACMGVHTNPSWLLGNHGGLSVYTYQIYIYQPAWFL